MHSLRVYAACMCASLRAYVRLARMCGLVLVCMACVCMQCACGVHVCAAVHVRLACMCVPLRPCVRRACMCAPRTDTTPPTKGNHGLVTVPGGPRCQSGADLYALSSTAMGETQSKRISTGPSSNSASVSNCLHGTGSCVHVIGICQW